MNKAEERAHILEGLILACDHLDEVIAIIRASKTRDMARENLRERFGLSDVQAKAIVDMRLGQLTGMEQEDLREKYNLTMEQIAYLKTILEDNAVCMKVVTDELLEIKEKYADERRSEIVYASEEFNPEDLTHGIYQTYSFG